MSQGLQVLVLVGTGELFRRRPEQLAALAAQQGMPVIYQYREFVAAETEKFGKIVAQANIKVEN